MKNLTLENIALVCGGILCGGKGKKQQEISGVFIDSRKVEKRGLFVPLKGARVDAHNFIDEVMAQGSMATITEKELGEKPYPYIIVKSSLKAVQDIAAFYLKQLDIPVVGITGSVGKTSTKEMIAAVLSQKYQVLKTDGNFNNELGLPLTVFRLKESHEIAVLEMGIRNFGDMHQLANIARPNICVITNINACHLEFLKSLDGVFKAKTEIFDFIPPEGNIILNGDDDQLSSVDEIKGIRPVFFGIKNHTSIWADEIMPRNLEGTYCKIHVGDESFTTFISIPGRHMVYNALAGTAVGLTCGLTLEEIKQGIEDFKTISGRLHIIETGNYTVIDDCYNANPMSMMTSLDVLADTVGRKVAILGDMGELGENQADLHRGVGVYATSLDVDLLICVGNLARYMAEAARTDSTTMEIQYFETKEKLIQGLPQLLKKTDTILVKASRFMKFENIVKYLNDLT